MGRLLTGQVQVNYVLIHAQVLKSAVLHVSYNMLSLGGTIHPSHQKSHHAKNGIYPRSFKSKYGTYYNNCKSGMKTLIEVMIHIYSW
jgi:hypothetical protein